MSNLQKAIEAVNDQAIQQVRCKCGKTRNVTSELRKCDYCTRPAEYRLECPDGLIPNHVCYLCRHFVQDTERGFCGHQATEYQLVKRSY